MEAHDPNIAVTDMLQEAAAWQELGVCVWRGGGSITHGHAHAIRTTDALLSPLHKTDSGRGGTGKSHTNVAKQDTSSTSARSPNKQVGGGQRRGMRVCRHGSFLNPSRARKPELVQNRGDQLQRERDSRTALQDAAGPLTLEAKKKKRTLTIAPGGPDQKRTPNVLPLHCSLHAPRQ